MPDYAAHYIFGETLLGAHQVQAVVTDEATLAAWNWGLQGPDPLFFRKSTDPAAGAMHHGAPEGMMRAMLRYMEGLPKGRQEIARAWFWGLLAHYFLDRTVHPYVHAQMEEMARRMPDATGNGCHYHVENDIDADLYLYIHRQPLSAFDPSRGMALLPWQKEVIAGMMAAGSAAKGVFLSVPSVVRAINNTAIAEKVFFRGGTPVRTAARGLELLLGKSRQFTGLIKGGRPGWDILNLSHASWTDLRDGSAHTQSVPDLMDQARKDMLPVLDRLLEGSGLPDLGGMDFGGEVETAA